MKAIGESAIAEMCREMTCSRSLSAAMDYLEAHQPEVLHYLMMTFDDGRIEAGMKACQLGWCVYRAFELEGEGPIPRITVRELAAKADANQNLLRGTSSATLPEFLEVMSLEMAAQPLLMQFLRQMLAAGLSIDLERNRQLVPDLVAIFLAVKTVVDTLDAATNG
ncbi:MAG: hypothetical protein KJ000_09625 [Pirellulaceae bacterium]|nr:hypothetical protein [Pirellulaceae bacterium]